MGLNNFELKVVSYRNSTSNHNSCLCISEETAVVSYRNSTSNHNYTPASCSRGCVVSYRNSTSNHNPICFGPYLFALYLIEILHQTTTIGVLSRFALRCILSKFYIKPQLARQWLMVPCVVSYRNSTSNHNICPLLGVVFAVVSYRNSTSNHNVGPHID